MAKNRVIYQSEAVFVGPSPATGAHCRTAAHAPALVPSGAQFNLIKQLFRVQSANYSFNIARQDVNQYGELVAIDRIILEQPTVSLDFTYLLANMQNEYNLGFTVTNTGAGSLVSAISGILTKEQDEKNYFIRIVPEGNDVFGYSKNLVGSESSSVNVIGIGNGFLSSYATEGSVGNFPTVSVNVEALNMKFDSISSGKAIPAVNPVNGAAITNVFYVIPTGNSSPDGSANNPAGMPFVSALRPGDITATIVQSAGGAYSDPGVDITDWKLQSYNLSVDLNREPLLQLGSKYAFSREITFPVSVQGSVTANVGELASGNLVDLISADRNYDITVTMKQPSTTIDYLKYVLKNAKFDSQQFSSSIGANKSVTLNFSAQIGGAQQTDRGFFFSGAYSTGLYPI